MERATQTNPTTAFEEKLDTFRGVKGIEELVIGTS